MWIFILLLTLFQGLSTYLMSISIAQIKLNYKSINKTFLEISPYKLLDNYTPDQIFDNVIISIISRGLLFITGCTGILLFLTIHDIYYRINKSKSLIKNRESTEILHEIMNTDCNSSNLRKYPDELVTGAISHYVSDNLVNQQEQYDIYIDLMVDMKIIENGLNLNNIINSLAKYNIICKRNSFIDKSDKSEKPSIEPLTSEIFYYICVNNIDDAIFILNKEYPKKIIEQTVCICLEEDYNKSIFKHLCISVSNNDDLYSEEYQKLLTNKIIELVNN